MNSSNHFNRDDTLPFVSSFGFTLCRLIWDKLRANNVQMSLSPLVVCKVQLLHKTFKKTKLQTKSFAYYWNKESSTHRKKKHQPFNMSSVVLDPTGLIFLHLPHAVNHDELWKSRIKQEAAVPTYWLGSASSVQLWLLSKTCLQTENKKEK